MADKFNFSIDQGSTHQDAIFLEDEAGDAINLTGYTAVLNLRRTFDDPVMTLTLTSLNAGGLTVTPQSGRIDIKIPKETTDGLSGSYVYDLSVTDSAGVRTRILEGVATVNQKVQEAP